MGLSCCRLVIKPHEERLVMDEERKWFLEMEASLGDDVVKIVERQ